MDHLFVGLDVAKAQLDVHVRPTGETFALPHDEAGLAALVDRVRTLAPTLIALEATGGYEATVAAILASVGLPVAVVNPRQIRDCARATGLLAKTDTSMPASSRTVPRPCAPRSARCPPRMPSASANS
jgi:transposase